MHKNDTALCVLAKTLKGAEAMCTQRHSPMSHRPSSSHSCIEHIPELSPVLCWVAITFIISCINNHPSSASAGVFAYCSNNEKGEGGRRE